MTLTSEDDSGKEKPQVQSEKLQVQLASGSPQVRVMESSENENTKERLVLLTIQSENSQVSLKHERFRR